MAGWSYAAGGVEEAVIWPRGGAAVVLFPGMATGIDASGLVVGTITTTTGDRAVTWDREKLTELPIPTSATSTASGVDDRGDLVGSVTTAAGSQNAAMWTRHGLVDLGPGDALAVNNRREIVGTSDGNSVMWRGATTTMLTTVAH